MKKLTELTPDELAAMVKRIDPTGTHPRLADLLAQKNELLEDIGPARVLEILKPKP